MSSDEHADLDATLGAMFDSVKAYIDKGFAEVETRIAALEKGNTKFCGIHQRALQYQRGSMVTHDGALWCAVRDIAEDEVPGKASTGWQLAVKSAR